jgi:hypothetical protein
VRILHVTHSGAFGGGEIALERLVPQLLERGFDNVVEPSVKSSDGATP